MRMEALISRIRLLVVTLNAALLAFVLDTRAMHMQVAWIMVAVTFVYGVPYVVFQPYRRWPVFGARIASSALDSIGIMVFISATGGSESVLPAVLPLRSGRGDAVRAEAGAGCVRAVRVHVRRVVPVHLKRHR